MYDLSMPNSKPGPCAKCGGTGTYSWGVVTNGKPSRSGSCNSCSGKGHQTREDIQRNESYNRHKLANMEL